MTNVTTSVSFGHPEILPATKEEMPIVANLFELYAHDFSEFYSVEPGPDVMVASAGQYVSREELNPLGTVCLHHRKSFESLHFHRLACSVVRATALPTKRIAWVRVDGVSSDRTPASTGG